MRLYIDTETDSPKPQEANLLQLAAILTDDQDELIHSLELLIKPTDWVIPPGAIAIHGITNEFAAEVGLPLEAAAGLFSELLELIKNNNGLVIAHNYQYDSKVLQRAFAKSGLDLDLFPDDRHYYCTMLSSVDLCKLPGKYGFKWPKLQEAHQFFFGEKFEGAHGAMADVQACRRIYLELIKERAHDSARNIT